MYLGAMRYIKEASLITFCSPTIGQKSEAILWLSYRGTLGWRLLNAIL